MSKEKLAEIEEQRAMKKLAEFLERISHPLSNIVKAVRGEDIDANQLYGFTNVDDLRERTRVNANEMESHTYMRLMSAYGGEPFGIFGAVADMEDTYLISLDGEQRKEAILMVRAKQETPSQQVSVSIPNVETKPPKPEKKHFWQRGKKE